MRGALYLSTVPSCFCFSLNTHLQSTTFCPLLLRTKRQVEFFCSAANSTFIASVQFRSFRACTWEYGSAKNARLLREYLIVPSLYILGWHRLLRGLIFIWCAGCRSVVDTPLVSPTVFDSSTGSVALVSVKSHLSWLSTSAGSSWLQANWEEGHWDKLMGERTVVSE